MSARSNRQFRRLPASMLLLLLGIMLLVGAAVQAIRSARAQQDTVSRVLHNYARVAAWNFEQQALPVFRNAIEPMFHPLHEPSFASGAVAPYSVNVLLDNPAKVNAVCRSLLDATRYGARFLLRGSNVETSVPLPQPVLDSLMRVVRAHVLHTPANDRLSPYNGMHGFTLQDTAVVVMYYTKLVPRDTVIYALVLDPLRMNTVFDGILAAQPLLPEPLLAGVANTDLIMPSIELADDGGLIYGSYLNGPQVGERVMRELGSLVMRVQLRDDAEKHLILGASPALRWPFLLALLVIAIGLLIVAYSQMRREHALAQLRSDFVSNVSHELRTPLALQRIFLDMLRLGRVDTADRRAWCFDNIDRESLRLAHLVENVLHFSRSERGTMRITTERALLEPVISDILRAFEPLAATSHATIDAQLDHDVAAPVDASALRQVLMNLLENAVKYGPAAQRITVRLALAEGDSARITVDDEGSGVPSEERLAIFQPYRRGAAIFNTAVAGSGIGLAVVHGLVAAHGGRVYVTDAPHQGARFVVELPHASREPSREPVGASGSSATAADHTALR